MLTKFREEWDMHQWERDLIEDRKSGEYCPLCGAKKGHAPRMDSRHIADGKVCWEIWCDEKKKKTVYREKGIYEKPGWDN